MTETILPRCRRLTRPYFHRAARLGVQVSHRFDGGSADGLTTVKPKKKITLRTVVKAAKDAGCEVSVGLKPKEVNIEPIHLMTQDMDAIYHLMKSRNRESIQCAEMLARRISYNQIMFTCAELLREDSEKPVLERP